MSSAFPLPKFIQISTLTSYPAVLLNRDDAGMAKRMPFGGAERLRVSSQCLKRHWRRVEDGAPWRAATPDLDLAVRSREIFKQLIAQPLVEEGKDETKVVELVRGLGAMIFGGKSEEQQPVEDAESGASASKKKKKDAPHGIDSTKTSQVCVLGKPEIEFLTDLIRKEYDSGKGWEEKRCKKEYGKLIEAMGSGGNAGLDVAMFGRFVSNVSGARKTTAVHVAHAITVHAEESEPDYFTAVDDLTTESGSGSAHLNVAELTSGIYYGYVVVDVPQLVENLGPLGSKRDTWLSADRTVAAALVETLLGIIPTVTPGAKLGSTAPHAVSDLVLVEMGDRQPRTLANAFLKPVSLKAGDVMVQAREALARYLAACDDMYGSHEHRHFACLDSKFDLPSATRKSLPDLAKAVKRAIVRGQIQ